MEPEITTGTLARRVVGYKVFNNNDELVIWQQEEAREIYSIIPMMLSFGGDMTNEKFNASSNVGCFVTYRV